LLVHRSKIAADENDCLLDRLRKSNGAELFLIHRLDRATSGAVLLAKSREIAGALGKQFMERSVEKRYLAVVRGWPESDGSIDYPLPDVRDNSPRKPALTNWRVLHTCTVPIELGKYPEQRYALVEASPQTGRYRQIRKHFTTFRTTSSAIRAMVEAITIVCGACTSACIACCCMRGNWN
jgi:tRNA pseudouridine65 synthase